MKVTLDVFRKKLKKLYDREAKMLAVYAGFAVACSLLAKCIPHILEMSGLGVGTDIISVVVLVMSVIIAECNVEIFVIGLLSSGFALYGVMEKSLVKIDKYSNLFKIIEIGLVAVSVCIVFFTAVYDCYSKGFLL